MKLEFVKDKKPMSGEEFAGNLIGKLLTHSFEIIQKELGLADDPRTVQLSIFKKLSVGEGATNAEATDPFEIHLAQAAPYELMATLCHEMFHVRDMVNGDLVEEGHKSYYKGKQFSQAIAQLTQLLGMDAQVLPWEHEAYVGMFPLAIKVYQQLPPEDVAWLNKTYAFYILPPTIPEFYAQKAAEMNKRVKEPA